MIATATTPGTPPTQTHRVSRCVVCDTGVTWKGAASRPACPRCGGSLTTSTRQRRAGFILLEGADLERAERLPNGLAATAAWHQEQADRYAARLAEYEQALETGDAIAEEVPATNWYAAHTVVRMKDSTCGWDLNGLRKLMEREQAKAAKLERRLAKLGGPLEA